MVILAVPLVVISKVIERFSKLREVSHSEVVSVLNSFLSRTSDDGEWDWFINGGQILDPALEDIRKQCQHIEDWDIKPEDDELILSLLVQIKGTKIGASRKC